MSELETTTLDDGIELLTLNRPERRNALAGNTLAALHDHVDRVNGDPTIRVVIITGAGASFCSGADMKATAADHDAMTGTPYGSLQARARNATARTFAAQELMAGLFEKIHRLRQPVIAAVNGHAHGGGFALALACDIRFAAESASFGAVFIKRGVSACDMGTSYHLPRLVGASRSAELLLTGRVFDAAEAHDMGLVLDVVPDGTVVDRALATARLVAENGPLAVWMTKETMWQTVDAPSLRHALDLENRTQILCTGTGELTEAFQAFVSGTTPVWQPL
ncbi:MAG: enoyl-CoA hydratase/isomerase family protein [Acidimicrobiales bacterium]|nr:enoyl-CoA hydratase/isomerase family protein [Acidimicrobiales bacterium]